MDRNRFRLSLRELRSSNWQIFEELASEFLVDEFPSLRTTATSSGDGGRDAKLFQPGGEETVAFQYSIRVDWSTKISSAVTTVKANFPKTTRLIYVTNQEIGAKGDDAIAAARKNHAIDLDIKDQNWFLERRNTTPARQEAAEALGSVADSFLASAGVIERKSAALTSPESQAACVYLGLQFEDDTREKGLTKLCFEALVRSALRSTDSENRLGRQEIRSQIRQILPTHDAATVDRHTDSALRRLEKRFVRHWKQEDGYCLTFEETVRINARLMDLAVADEDLNRALAAHIHAEAALRNERLSAATAEAMLPCTRRVLDQVLWQRGEVFAASVAQGNTDFEFPELEQVARETLANGETPSPGSIQQKIIIGAATEALSNPSPGLQKYLRNAADAYTLFAFMRETPDVQSAVVKMFSKGDVWLDTTVILPLFAEELVDSAEARTYTSIFRAARQAGIGLHMTRGVLEEVESHMHRSLTYARRAESGQTWEGRVPFLAAAFALTGRARGSLPNWLERYRGDARGQDDVAEYLQDHFGIRCTDLDEASTQADPELRAAVQTEWEEAHERRRTATGAQADAMNTARLVRHDVENYLGVIGRRAREDRSPFGFSTWWLTTDRTAHRLHYRLSQQFQASNLPPSPVMSPDFLVNYLAVGPIRGRLEDGQHAQLPISVADIPSLDLLPTALLDAAEEIREELQDMPEHVKRRRVRDSLDASRRRMGGLANNGLDDTLSNITASR
ncbi:MAG: hypothetical protein WC558_09610 [Patulibacter sp.]